MLLTQAVRPDYTAAPSPGTLGADLPQGFIEAHTVRLVSAIHRMRTPARHSAERSCADYIVSRKICQPLQNARYKFVELAELCNVITG